ncbi:oxygenase MpaB family protein [Floricoccus penangensis]|uniref:oxygenase MpaB family protein n=1 Tax=Floricoccus penangensis TaxID=1859475 RepID=UPI00203EEF32|nr:oxygenase MpaB family protein [Floricoccus penangensis]URZ88310.1 DUF2236 domain-containing protein [Floricoccus penangensis]
MEEDSIVREMWGEADTVLFIFGGCAAEFALNKAVDWLYFTGKLPNNPIGRLFSTIKYSHAIMSADPVEGNLALENIVNIHRNLQKNRKMNIPNWAFKDVLYMLIYYSIVSYEALERKVTDQEKEEVFEVFYRIGTGLLIKDLPKSYGEWEIDYQKHLDEDLKKSELTDDLLKQYKRNIGAFRYFILVEIQKLLVNEKVRSLLNLKRFSLVSVILPFYKFSRLIKLDGFIRNFLLPKEFKEQVKKLDII